MFGHTGVILGQPGNILGHSGAILHPGVILRSSWGHPWVILGSSQGHPRVILGSSWGHPGVILGSSLGIPHLNTLIGHLKYMEGHPTAPLRCTYQVIIIKLCVVVAEALRIYMSSLSPLPLKHFIILHCGIRVGLDNFF